MQGMNSTKASLTSLPLLALDVVLLLLRRKTFFKHVPYNKILIGPYSVMDSVQSRMKSSSLAIDESEVKSIFFNSNLSRRELKLEFGEFDHNGKRTQ